MSQVGNIPLTVPSDTLPEGTFLLPVCCTIETVEKILNSLKRDEMLSGDRDFTAQEAVLEALAFVEDPENAPCFPASNCEEDTYSDSIYGFLDEIISNIMEGGIITAIGYVIDTLGNIIVETALRLVTVTIVGYLTGGLVSIFIDSVLTETVAVGAGADVMIKISALDDEITLECSKTKNSKPFETEYLRFIEVPGTESGILVKSDRVTSRDGIHRLKDLTQSQVKVLRAIKELQDSEDTKSGALTEFTRLPRESVLRVCKRLKEYNLISQDNKGGNYILTENAVTLFDEQ